MNTTEPHNDQRELEHCRRVLQDLYDEVSSTLDDVPAWSMGYEQRIYQCEGIYLAAKRFGIDLYVTDEERRWYEGRSRSTNR